MKFKVNLPYSKSEDTKRNEPDQQTTLNIITYTVNSKYKEGLEGQLRRVFGRLLIKLEDALDQKKDHIDVEYAELEMIKSAMNEKVPASWAKFMILFEDEVNSVHEEEAKKAVK